VGKKRSTNISISVKVPDRPLKVSPFCLFEGFHVVRDKPWHLRQCNFQSESRIVIKKDTQSLSRRTWQPARRLPGAARNDGLS